MVWPCKEVANRAFAGSLCRPPGGRLNLPPTRRVHLTVRVDKPKPNYFRDGIFIVVVLIAVLSFELFSGTGREVRTYNVPKEQSARAAAPESKPNPSSLIQFAKPEDWIDNTDASGLATLSFALPGNAEVSAIPLPARLAENPMIVNMWREQVGLGPVDEASVKGLTKPIMIGGSTGRLFDFAGTKPLAGQDDPPRIVSASVVLGQVGWFFKLSGSAGAVEPQFAAFTNFIATLKFRPAASEVNFDKIMEEARQANPPPPAPAAVGPSWTKPAGWAEQPRTAMRLGNFTAGGGKAEIYVMTFPGKVGGLLANVNRWRGESGLPPIDAVDLANSTSKLTVSGTPATLVEAIGAANGSLSVYHPADGLTWFYKMSGPSDVVTAEKGAFMEFVQSIQFPKP